MPGDKAFLLYSTDPGCPSVTIIWIHENPTSAHTRSHKANQNAQIIQSDKSMKQEERPPNNGSVATMPAPTETTSRQERKKNKEENE